MVGGESHYFLGRRYRLRVTEHDKPNNVTLRGNSAMILQVRPGTTRDKRQQILNDWYRRYMKEIIPDLIQKWEPTIGVRVNDWGVKKMKTRWGSCNIRDRRVWLNLDLAKSRLTASNTS